MSTSSYFAKTGNPGRRRRHRPPRPPVRSASEGYRSRGSKNRETGHLTARCRPRAAGPGRGRPGGSHTACRARRSRPGGAPLAYAGVEATLEAELERDPDTIDVRGERDRGLEVRGERLLAERRLAGAERRTDELGMGRRRGGDDGGVRRVDGVVTMEVAGVIPVSAATSAARAGSASAMRTSSMPGVSRSSRACSRPMRPAPSNATLIGQQPLRRRRAPPRRRNVAASTRRPIAALSDGGPKPCPARPSASHRSRARSSAAMTPSRSSSPAPSSVKSPFADGMAETRARPARSPSSTDGSTSLRCTCVSRSPRCADRRDGSPPPTM